MLGVTDAEAPLDKDDVGVRVLDAASVSLLDGVESDVLDGVGVGVPEPVADIETLSVDEPVPESEPVFEGLAPLVRLAVGVRVKDLVRLCVELAVDDGVGVPVGVVLAVGVMVADRELDRLDVSEIVGDTDGLEPEDNVDVGLFDIDALKVADVDGVIEAVPVIEEVPDTVGVPLGVEEAD